uniref:Speckle-type POZ protein (inferred by orthology to a human protein) n=1 Tax=Strongyloides venezuelensis TaxID=75913 RepID=A0A0K0FGG1_STRVS
MFNQQNYGISEESHMSQTGKLEVVSKQTTKVIAVCAKLEWKIDQFEKLMKLFKNGQSLVSKQFSCPQAPNIIWELHIYPNGKREEDVGNVSFFLRQTGLRNDDPLMTEFQIYALAGGNSRVSVCRDTKDFVSQQGRGKFQVSREKMMPSIKIDGSLDLVCEVEYLPPDSKIIVEENTSKRFDKCEFVNSPMYNVFDNVRKMYESELFTDCVIVVGNKEFKAHKCILGQHSEVFRSMLNQGDMTEGKDGVVYINDANYESFRALLNFIYTGSTSGIEDFADDVLMVADKYAVLPLKEHCEQLLAKNINVRNVTRLLTFADTHSAIALKQHCIIYISHRYKEILESCDWKELKKSNSELANEVLEKVLNLKSSPNNSFSESFDRFSSLKSNYDEDSPGSIPYYGQVTFIRETPFGSPGTPYDNEIQPASFERERSFPIARIFFDDDDVDRREPSGNPLPKRRRF